VEPLGREASAEVYRTTIENLRTILAAVPR